MLRIFWWCYNGWKVERWLRQEELTIHQQKRRIGGIVYNEEETYSSDTNHHLYCGPGWIANSSLLFVMTFYGKLVTSAVRLNSTEYTIICENCM